MKKAIYPGSFDPIHQGHIEILKKGIKLFDFIYVVVSFNKEKTNQTNLEKRFENVKTKLKNFKNIKVLMNKDKPTAFLAKQLKVNFLIRSCRNNTDFKYELELALGNKTIFKDLETVLIVPDLKNVNYQSRLIAQLGEDNDFSNG